MLKNGISTLVEECVPLLPALLALVPVLYQASLHPSVTDLMRQVGVVMVLLAGWRLG